MSSVKISRKDAGVSLKDSPVLVATDVVADAYVIADKLNEEFGSVFTSTDQEQAVADFEKHRPSVLVLAFDSLEKSERYYLGLYRLSTLASTLQHRTVVLCNRDEMRRAYEFCKRGYFDDYVVYWPLNFDAQRLPMTVLRALRERYDAGKDAAMVSRFSTQGRLLSGLEGAIDRQTEWGRQRLKIAGRSLRRMEAETRKIFGETFEGAAHGMPKGSFGHWGCREIVRLVHSSAAALQSLQQWVDDFKNNLEPQLTPLRTLCTLAESVPPLLLVVDDDNFQRELLKGILEDTGFDLVFASSGNEALAVLGKYHPALILMDIHLPDIDGVEVTRRIKSIDAFADVRILMVTSQRDKDTVLESLKAGATDFIVKPLNREALLAKIDKSLGSTAVTLEPK